MCHGFQGNARNTFLLCPFLHPRAGTVSCGADEIDRELERVERKPINHGHCGRNGVSRKTYVSYRTFLPSFNKCLDGSGRAKDRLDFVQMSYGMELVKIDMIGSKALE